MDRSIELLEYFFRSVLNENSVTANIETDQRFLKVFQLSLIFRYQNFKDGFGEFFALFARAARKIYTFLISKDNFLIDFLISERIFHQVIFRSPNISLNLISTVLKLRKTFLKKNAEVYRFAGEIGTLG